MALERIMWIENKSAGNGLSGPARIGRVTFSRSRRSIQYRGRTFQASKSGYKWNYIDADNGDLYWISGCRKDGRDALYATDVEVDEDVREEYWVTIRNQPQNRHLSRFRAHGKY